MGRSAGGGFGGGGFSGGFSGGGRMSGGFSGGRGFGGGRSSMGGSGYGGSGFGGAPMFVGGSGGGMDFLGGFIMGQLLGGSRDSGYRDSGYPPPSGQPVDSNGMPRGGIGQSGDPSHRGSGNGNNGSGAGSCLTFVLVFIAAALLVTLFASLLGTGGCSSQLAGGSEHASTVERQALSSGMVIETAYYTDDDGDWIDDPKTLENGMRQFYMETGVQPYLYILPNGSERTVNALTNIAEEKYGELFQDEGHFLAVFCDNGYGGFGVGYCIGSAAKTVMDSEAISIYQDYLDRYYSDYSLSESEIFAETYISTADRIMTTDAERNAPIAIALIIGIVIVIVIICVVAIVRRRAKTREAELRHQQEVLNTPLEKFDDDDIEQTAKKYAQGRADIEGQPKGASQQGIDPRDLGTFGDPDLEELERKYSGAGAGGATGPAADVNASAATQPVASAAGAETANPPSANADGTNRQQ